VKIWKGTNDIMGNAVYLDVNGKQILSTDVTYQDLVWLYTDFKEKHGRLPRTSEGLAKNNLPQQRIIKRVLENIGITYNDFMLQFGKIQHIRADIKNYDFYIKRFKDVSDKLGRALLSGELINNTYGLPSASWLAKNCPDKSVVTYDDFVKWLGYESNKLQKNDEDVANKLIALEKQLGRPITRNDITLENVGFSNIVITRIWGSLGKCKKELGLMKTLPIQPKPFEYYKNLLDEILDNISSSTDRRIISWKDIESKKYNPTMTEHKTFAKSFKSANVDIFSYIKSKGFMMNPSNFSFHYTFDNGERVLSSMEYDYSLFLQSLGYVYNNTYKRDILYRTFIPNLNKTKANCDYVICKDDIFYYIEIAGVIHKDWETAIYSSKQETDYQNKMFQKKEWLESAGVKYLFLFPEDFQNDKYKDIAMNFLQLQ
jgi:hypothetical protein